jgi:predicted short-subunit dehydrogenase-like oxidoreductase (DUF2520 family)
MSDIVIIGAGKVGTSLGYALSRKKHRIKALVCKSIYSAKESQKIIGQGEIYDDKALAVRKGQWIILSVPDDEIEKTARELATSNMEWEGRFVFHCSGLHSTESLKHLEKRGALAASIHPIQSFPQKKPTLDVFRGIYFGLEGKGKALELAKRVARQLEGRYVILESKDKPLYHVACSMASNFLVTLLDAVSFLLEQTGLDENVNSQILFPLVQGTLQNVKNFDTRSALTGPIFRGDEESIQKHLKALRKFPLQKKLYQELSAYTLQIVEEEKILSSKKIRALRDLLGEK